MDITNGTLRVSSLDFRHVYRFANSTKKYRQPIADAICAESKLLNDHVTVQLEDLGGELKIDVQGTQIDIMIGSASYDVLAHEPPQFESCGVPNFHHELLYAFSCERPTRACVPVCIVYHDQGKNPVVGHCVPGTLMQDIPTSAASSQDVQTARAVQRTARGRSLHLGL